jgi:glycosyltransferase involved in cell wall biosynthesis
MKIGFDLRPFLREETGVGIYLRNLLFELARLDPANEYYLFSASWKDRFPTDNIPPFGRLKFRDGRIPVKLLNFFWYRWAWPHLDRFFGTPLDLTHSATPLILPTGGKKIVTVHDLFFLDAPGQSGPEAGKFFFRRLASSLGRADGIITFSRFIRDKIVTRFGTDPARIKIIPHGLDPKFQEDIAPSDLEEARRNHQLPSSFLLFVGAQEPRKNLPRLIEALKIVHLHGLKIPLVLVGPKGQDSERLQAKADELGLSSWIRMTGYLGQRDVRHVYRLAEALVFPSLCEGFGFPPLEAMASSVPVIASSAPAIPEVCQDAAAYFAPDSPEEMAKKIISVLEDSRAKEELVSKGKQRAAAFSWEKAAERTLAYYRSLAEG